MVTEVAVMPGADAWLLVEPVLLLLPQAATSAAATPMQAAFTHRLELGNRTFTGAPPMSADPNDVSGAIDDPRRPMRPLCPGFRGGRPASPPPVPHRTPPAADRKSTRLNS